jgi:hypothetical protein
MTSTNHLWFQCCHILNSKESWTKDDGTGFNAEKFYLNIISLFEDDDVWVKETLNWWNECIYYHHHHTDAF